MCFPQWHDDAVFSALIGGESVYSIYPRTRFVWGGYYEPGSLIWRSRWVTDGAIAECREALVAPSEARRAVIVRRLTTLKGTVHLEVTLRPAAGFDRYGLSRLQKQEDGCWTARLGEDRLHWQGGEEARPEHEAGEPKALRLELELEAGESHDFVLAIERAGAAERELPPADVLWKQTEEWWGGRVPPLQDTAAPRDARHAYAVMAGLTGSGGGTVAAATTSLPERARQGRNYDYRYVWIRDQCYVGQAVARAGPFPLMDQAVDFVTARMLQDGASLEPAYTVEGDPVPEESRLELAGYPGGRGITGNHVREQFQLDGFGETLLLFARAADHDHLGADQWRAAEIAAEAIAERRYEPEAGLWELEPKRWTHSLLSCGAGLRALAGHARTGETRARWLALADDLLAEASRIGLHPSGRWQRAQSDPRVDAALLLGAIRGAMPAEDPRSIQTLAAVEEDLTEDGYCYRYRAQGLPLGESEGSFLLCGFWMCLAYAQQGNPTKAVAWFERNRAACGPPGLLSEEFDVRQRQLRGNLPQAFVHALLLECAAVLGSG